MPRTIGIAPAIALRSAPVSSATTLEATGEFSRTEELVQEQRRVTRIIRFTEPTGTVEEYRMETHAFGGVYHFQDSRSITERDFAQAIAD